ncbi:MAG: hypothetical protein AAFN74_28030, partial [Myxococcota bacterium]
DTLRDQAQRVFVVDRLKAWEALMGVGALADDPPEPFMSGGQLVTDPSGHLESLVTTLGHGRAKAYVCARRMAVTTSTCTPESLDSIRDAVRAFGQALTLRSRFADGVPFRPAGGPQAPVVAEMLWKAPGQTEVPIGGVPVAFKGPTNEGKVETNGKGRADWRIADVDAKARVGVRVDAEGLLGAEAGLWAN